MSPAALLRWFVWAGLWGWGLFAPAHAQTLLWQQLSGGGTGDPAMLPFWGLRCDRQSLLATDAQGHSVVASTYRDRYTTGGLITRYGSGGQRLWQTTYRPDGAVLHAVALLADGDVVVAGLVPRFSSLSDVQVMRLEGESGAVRWSTTLHTGSLIIGGQEVALSVGADGDVRVAGMRWVGSNQLFVARLRGSTGQVLWDVQPSGTLTLGLCDLLVNASGDAVVGELGRVEGDPRCGCIG